MPHAHEPAPVPAPAHHLDEPASPADLFDYAHVGRLVGFTLRSLRRHKLVASACVLAVVALSVLYLVTFPRTYRVQAIILALRNPVMSTLSNPNLFRPYESDAPTRAARETVLRRDNLVALINQVDLLRKEKATRAPIHRFLDYLFHVLSGRDRTHDEEVDALVDQLEKRLTVDVAEGTVTISIEWHHAQTAYELVEAAMQNFLETRHTSEISIISDAIAILETYAGNLQNQINASMESVSSRERATRRVRAPAPRPRTVLVRPRATATPADAEYTRIQNALTAKRRAISDLEEFRQRRLAELQSQLLQYQAMYAEGHPAVQSSRQNIEALSAPSPQIEALRAEAAELERELMRKAPPNVDTAALLAAAAAREEPPEPTPVSPDLEFEDPKLTQDKSQLRMLLQNYSNLLERISAARLELDASQAAFKYRYSVVSPPQMPKRAERPKPARVLGASLVGGLLLALFACTLVDVRSRRLVERWQLERQLGVPVIAELRK